MKLHIPSFDEISLPSNLANPSSVIRKRMQRAVKTALKDINLQELYQELIEKTDNMTPLTEGEFKQVENQWIFMRVIQGEYLYLMFKPDDNSEGRYSNSYDNTLLFFVEVRPMPKWIDGELSPKRNKDWSWDSFKILSYEDNYKDILSWANIYLVKSYGMPSFMNWKGNPLIK